ncbi:MAG: hypothetical protein CME70_23235 [Halobacteriovorax sp.]|nr:hypothetical protein [Halobacteriovorax sp.]|tara:strand:+ start:82875 stop:83255 length:381 start_codon:yes stop_codon:yes gene_type:complete
MVKIPDLTNKQLVSQLEKYGKIMRQLVGERDKRAAANDTDDLYTKAERAEREAARAAAPEASSDGSGDNLLSFDEDELTAMEDKAKEAQAKAEDDDEEVRVTQLLQLSKEDLAALQANKKKIQKKG